MTRPTRSLRSTIESCRSSVATRLAAAAIALLCCTGSAFAGAGAPVNIDGNLQDMINYAGTISVPGSGCAFNEADPQKDVRIFDPKIVPCVAVVDNYYANGFDQILDVLAYDRSVKTLYLGIRTAGAIGDPDGNGDPNSKCPQATFDDETGIGFDDTYKWEINTDCAGAPEITIELRDNTLTVTGASTGPKSYAYNGADLEVAIENINLPFAYAVRVFTGNIADGLGEDLHDLLCLPPGPQIVVDKSANPERICPDSNTTFTIVVTNPGVVPLQHVNLVDDLPAALSFVAGSSNSNCGLGQPNVNGQQLTWPDFSLDPGASCTITFQAHSSAQCLGPQVNTATATGSFATPCFQGGEPQTVQDSDDATVTCAPLPCVDITEINGPPSACINADVEITGTVQNCSPEAETIVVSLVGGGSVNLGSIAAGASVNFSLTGNMGNCTAGQNVPFTVNAVATNDCGTANDQASVNVLCKVPPCVDITALNAPADACQNTDVTISGTVQNCGGDPENITVALNGGPPQNLGTVAPGQSVNFSFTANMGACTAGQNVPFTVVATATNDCGTASDTDTRNVLCKVGPCVDITAIDGPASACPNANITITGTILNCSGNAENISVSLNGGQAINLGSIAAGQSVPFSIDTNMGECTAGQNVPFTVVATASNDCGQTSDTATHSVRCNALPCVDITAIKAPQSACQNADVQIEVTVQNCSIDPETITVSLNGGPAVNLGVVPGGGSVSHTFTANMGACTAGQNVNFSIAAHASNDCGTADDTDSRNVLCKVGPCVELTANCSPESACPGQAVTVSGSATNCSADPEDIVITMGNFQATAANVQPGGVVNYSFATTMPNCTDGEQVPFNVSASATNECGTSGDEASCSVLCKTPQIDVEKTAEAEVADGGTIHYTITLTNPSKVVTLENIQVCDDLCSSSTYQGGASPTPQSEPALGSAGGTVCWTVASLAPGQSLTFTFNAQAVGGGAGCTEDVTCHNVVRASASCGSAQARDEDSFDTVIPCEQGLCRFTGGGTLNENGGNRGHKQHSFGGNVSPCPANDGGPTGDSWEHVVREGHTIKFNFHSWDPCITACSVVPPGPCSPHGTITRADWHGTGKYSLGAGSREKDAYFEAVIIDHNEGHCSNMRDEYGITVWDAQTNQIVFSFPLQETDTGNLQIHETPRRIFGTGPALQPAPVGGELSEVALLGRPYPNPFAASMSFGYEVPTGDAQDVEIGIYNVAGRLITRLASEVQGPGRYTVRWDGRDAAGVQMAPGVYFLKSKVGQTQTVSRLLKVAQ